MVAEHESATRQGRRRLVWLLAAVLPCLLLLLLISAPAWNCSVGAPALGVAFVARIDPDSELPRGPWFFEGPASYSRGRLRSVRLYSVRIGDWYWMVQTLL